MWNIGSGVRLTDAASKRQTGTLSVAAARLRCVVSTPLGTPVVPDVYICTTGSRGLPAATRVRGLGGRQPRLVVLAHADDLERCGTPAATAAATSANAGPAINTGAPASATMAVSSGVARRQFSGTATAPILPAATSSSTTSGALRSRCAIRDPGPAPAASSPWASRFERSSSCE